MDLDKLAEKAKRAKSASSLKNKVLAYACGLGSIACLNGVHTSEFVGDDGHKGVKIEGVADNSRVLGGVVLGSVAACSVFFGAMKNLTSSNEKSNKSNDIARLKMMEKANGR